MSLFQTLFRKAMVLHEMGQVDESLQVFLHCLTVDEDFPGAKRQLEKVREFYFLISCFVEKNASDCCSAEDDHLGLGHRDFSCRLQESARVLQVKGGFLTFTHQLFKKSSYMSHL